MNLTHLLPEIIILLTACLLLVIEALKLKYSSLYSFLLTMAGLVITIWILLANTPSQKLILLNDAFVIDQLAVNLKVVILLIVMVVFYYSRDYLIQREINKPEYYVLGLFAVLGMMVIVSGASLLSLYMGLELMSLSMYAMVAFLRNSTTSSEAAVKYFVLGAIASGMLLYGMSFIYGITGTLNLSIIAKVLVLPNQSDLAIFAMIFIIAGILFKLGAVPFHMWLPDVYQGAPTSATLFISTSPKIAGFAMIMRLVVDGMGGLLIDWQQFLIVFAILSIVLGNVVAIAQTNFKRLLAYSGIAHIGFFLLGVLVGNENAYAAAMFYIIVYAVTTMGTFGIIILLSKKGFEADNLNDYKGLAKRHPWYAFLLLILLFSMAGVPPTVGFYAKLSVLKALMSIDMAWLAVTAVIFAIIGAYYYLRVIVYMYFVDSETDVKAMRPKLDVGMFVSLNAILVLMLGIYPSNLMDICIQAINAL